MMGGRRPPHGPCPLMLSDTGVDQVESLKATVIQSPGTGASLHFQDAEPDSINPYESETINPAAAKELNACIAIREVVPIKVIVFACNSRAQASFK